MISRMFPDKRFIFISTASVYGHADGLCTEKSVLNPLSLYAQTKLDTENEIKKGSNWTILRLGTAFGMREYTRHRNDLILQQMVNSALGGTIYIYGGERLRPYIHIQDIADAIIRAIDIKFSNEIFNLTTDILRIRAIAEAITIQIPSKLEYFDVDYDKRDYAISSAKAYSQRLLIPNKYISIGYGITETIDIIKRIDFNNIKFNNYESIKNAFQT